MPQIVMIGFRVNTRDRVRLREKCNQLKISVNTLLQSCVYLSIRKKGWAREVVKEVDRMRADSRA